MFGALPLGGMPDRARGLSRGPLRGPRMGKPPDTDGGFDKDDGTGMPGGGGVGDRATGVISATPQFADGGDVDDNPGGSIFFGEGDMDGTPTDQPMTITGQNREQYNRMNAQFPEGINTDELPDSDNIDDRRDGHGSSALDVIKDALTWGRQQFRLPISFFGASGLAAEAGGNDMSYDDGGEVGDDDGVLPDQPQQDVTTGGNTPQPPDPRQALQYLTGHGAVSPEIAQALEQHVDPQGQMDPAERKLAAIQAAPDAASRFGVLQQYRTKYNAYSGAARAAIDQGKLAQAATNASSAFAHIPTGYNVKFAPAPNGVAMLARKIGGAQPQQGADDGGMIAADETNPTAILKASKQSSYDDGGEVDDEDAGNGVIQEQPEEEVAPNEAQAPQQAQSQQSEQPVVLTPEQFKKAVDPGTFEKASEKGWGEWIKELLGTAYDAITAPPAGPTPGARLKSALAPASKDFTADQTPDPNAISGTKFFTAPKGQAPVSQPAPTPAPTPDPDTLQRSYKPKDDRLPGAPSNTAMGTPLTKEMIDEYKRRAWQAFPTDPQRRTEMFNGLVKHQQNMDVETSKERSAKDIRGATNDAMRFRVQTQEEGRDRRNDKNNAAKYSREELSLRMKSQNERVNAAVRLTGQQMAANPRLTPEEALQKIRTIAAGIGMRPQDLYDQASSWAAHNGQGGEGGQSSGGKQDGFVYKGTTYIRGPNGKYQAQ